MRLLLDCVHLGHGPLVRVGVEEGQWATVTHPDPGGYLAAVAGTVAARGSILLDDRDIATLVPHQRTRAGLATVTGYVPDLTPLRVVDVLSLGRPFLSGAALWEVALGLRRARATMAEAEAGVRNLAGRLGLAEWLAQPAARLPDPVGPLVDLACGLATAPRAMVWRRPEWLPGTSVDRLANLLREEQERMDLAIIEVRSTEGGDHGPT